MYCIPLVHSKIANTQYIYNSNVLINYSFSPGRFLNRDICVDDTLVINTSRFSIVN